MLIDFFFFFQSNDIFFHFFYFFKCIFIVKKVEYKLIIIINLFMIIILLLDYINYKYKDDDKPLSIIERWLFVGLLGWYLYVKYYKWYDYFFNFNRRMRRRRRRRQAEKKKNNQQNVPFKEVKKQNPLTRKEYYDLYMIGAFVGAATVALINFLIGGG